MKKNAIIIKKAILKMGGTIEEFIPERGCFYINISGKRIFLERKISITRQSFISGEMTRCKDITHKLLKAKKLPTPETECFYRKSYNRQDAEKRITKLKYPVILKDATGSNSRGIFPFINDSQNTLKLLEEQLLHYKSMIVQEMVTGKEYRFLVLDEKVIGALEMIPPRVVGDGVSTLVNLITEKQNHTKERTALDEKLDQILKEQGITLESILPKNETALIKKSSCLAEGGETRDVTELVHTNIEKICVEASKVVGKHLVGIDVMCQDVSIDPEKQSFNILEINGKPDLYIHYAPTHGETRDVVEEIVKFMIKIA
jgi:cyanophycin synthetase